MRPTLLALVLASSVPVVLSYGCAVEPDDPRTHERVDKGDEAIIGGTLDTQNQAVVWLYDEGSGSACSGTVIGKNGSIAWVLTAGHCNGMDYAIQANDFTDCFGMGNPGCLGVFSVTMDTPHPSWDGDPGNGFDFRILQVTGAAGASVIPPASNPDGISIGTAVEVSGFGMTYFGDQNNSERRHVTETVEDLYSNFIFADQNDGTGSCQGDSGGPMIYNGTVVGVTSFGDQTCADYGGYGRVQAVYTNWIAPIIGAPVMPNCDDCFQSAIQPAGACGPTWSACLNNQDCLDLLACFDTCSTQACYNTCAGQHPTGTDLYVATIDCACAACATECADECQSSSTSTGPGPGAGPTTGVSVGTGAGGAAGAGGNGGVGGSTGEGAAPSSGSGKNDDDDGDDEGQVIDSCACSAPGEPRSAAAGWLGLGAAALVAARLARTRRLGRAGAGGARRRDGGCPSAPVS